MDKLIKFSKPLIAAVQGPAIRIAFTTLALYDVVYCVSFAKFTAPFMKLCKYKNIYVLGLSLTIVALQSASETHY